VASRQSFSSAVALRERLQGAQNTAAIEEIRSLASYAKKTPSLASSAAGSSILSSGASLSSLSTTASLSNLKLVNLGEREMILAVSGTELQSRMTRGVLINKQAQIQKFCLNPTGASKELTEAMKILMTTCSAIATHPYLIITPPLANSDLAEPKEAEYIVASSGKFVALGRILDSLRGDKEIKIGIVVQHVKGMELLEGFLRGKGIRAIRSDGAGVREQQVIESRSGANVTLVIGGKTGARAIVVWALTHVD
jgi:Class II histone deacetylase complex subunits 2 and 3